MDCEFCSFIRPSHHPNHLKHRFSTILWPKFEIISICMLFVFILREQKKTCERRKWNERVISIVKKDEEDEGRRRWKKKKMKEEMNGLAVSKPQIQARPNHCLIILIVFIILTCLVYVILFFFFLHYIVLWFAWHSWPWNGDAWVRCMMCLTSKIKQN